MKSPDINKVLKRNTFDSESLVVGVVQTGESTSNTCKSESFILPDRSQMD